ncbi:jg22851 [Pararge aegeria aegeria]|uniref:Jg22851 protein n=2 Tax=Pararge aegeria TaxID=116150 RepID=A0A8S4QZD3_9NEOP|nr:jg22851 [Pararge aegeria aegeria]
MNKTAEQEEVMEIDGKAENAKPGEEEQLERYDDDEDCGDNVTLDRVLEYYTRRAANAADPEIILYAVNLGGVEHTFFVDAVKVYPDPNPVELEDDDHEETPEEISFKKMITTAVDEYMKSEEFKPVLQLAHEQLFIDWCTSRQIMTHRGNDL